MAEDPFDPQSFNCSWTHDGHDAAWVRVAGELDVATTPQLMQSLAHAQARAHLVVLDLRELAFADSAGVHVVVNAGVRARAAGGRLVIVRAKPAVDRVFELTGIADALDIAELTPDEPPEAVLRRLGAEDTQDLTAQAAPDQ